MSNRLVQNIYAVVRHSPFDENELDIVGYWASEKDAKTIVDEFSKHYHVDEDVHFEVEEHQLLEVK